MICYSTIHKKHIGINVQTSVNLERIIPLIKDDSYIYHIWNYSENINSLLLHLKNNVKENNVYIHLNSIKELSTNNIDIMNEIGIIVSLNYNEDLIKYKCILPYINKLHIEINKESLKFSIDSLNELSEYYYMINKYHFGFDIDINKLVNVEDDIKYLISMLKKYKNKYHIIKSYFFEFFDKLEIIDYNSFLLSYKDIGYLINDNNIYIYTNTNINYDNNTSITKLYNSLYQENDICKSCNGFLFCSKIKELPYCLNNNFVYKNFYELLSQAIISNSIIL